MSESTHHPGPAPSRHRPHRALSALDRLAFSIFGPPSREPRPSSAAPAVSRQDSRQAGIDDQFQSITVETDEYGHHYGLQKMEPKPVRPNPGVVYPYYSGRPPLDAPEV